MGRGGEGGGGGLITFFSQKGGSLEWDFTLHVCTASKDISISSNQFFLKNYIDRLVIR